MSTTAQTDRTPPRKAGLFAPLSSLLLGLAAALLAAACLVPSSALAAEEHQLTASFGETGHGDGQLELVAPKPKHHHHKKHKRHRKRSARHGRGGSR